LAPIDLAGSGQHRENAGVLFAKGAVFEFSFHRIHSKKVLDNRYTDMITSPMLSRQLTLPADPPAELTPSLPYSCSLLALVPALPSFRINHLQPLFAKHPGGGTQHVHAEHRVHSHMFSPWRIRSFVFIFLQIPLPGVPSHAVFSFHTLTNPFASNSFRFKSIQNPGGVEGRECPLC
jgi:hypothetical protein